MIEFDPHTIEGLRNVELATRLSMSFARHHYEQVLEFVPCEMSIYFGKRCDDGLIYHGVTCDAFMLKLEDGMIPFSMEMRFLDTVDGKRHWIASANNWTFAYRCEDLCSGFSGFEAAEFDASDVKSGLEKATKNPWVPLDGGSPLENPEDWDDLLRKALSSAFLVQRKFVDRCRKLLEFEAMGDEIEISPEVVSLISNIKKKS